MLRELVIRQAFVAIDLSLVVILAIVSCMLVMKLTNPAEGVGAPPEFDIATLDYSELFTEQKEREYYSAIMGRRLFGSAGITVPKVKEPVIIDDPIDIGIETKLPMTLLGTIVSGALSTATIENKSKRETDTYFAGQTLIDKYIVEEIFPRKVFLLNKDKNPPERETLSMQDVDGALASAALPGRTGRSTSLSSRSPGLITVKKAEFVKELTDNAATLVRDIDPQPYIDASGKMAGMTSNNLSKVPLAAKLGLKDGDVIQKVNGVTITSQEKVMEILGKFQNVPIFRVSILRDGKPQMLTFKVEQ